MMDIEILRKKLDIINDELSSLYQERLDVVEEIGKYKKQHAMPTLDKKREDEIIQKVTTGVKEGKKSYIERFFHFIMDESKDYQKV